MTSSWRKNTRCGARGPPVLGRRRSVLAVVGHGPQPDAQVGQPAQGPLRGGALDDEVAGEAAPVAGLLARAAPVGLRRRRARWPAAASGATAPAGAARSGRATCSPPRRASPVRAARSTTPVARGKARVRRGTSWPGLAGGRPVQRAEHGDLGVRPGLDDAAVHQPLVEVGARARRGPSPRRGPSRRAPAARPGRRRRRRASTPGRRRRRRGPAWAAAAPRRRGWPTGR